MNAAEVVWTVDRLTSSLPDFASLLETLAAPVETGIGTSSAAARCPIRIKELH